MRIQIDRLFVSFICGEVARKEFLLVCLSQIEYINLKVVELDEY
jgi:hypothetical protein